MPKKEDLRQKLEELAGDLKRLFLDQTLVLQEEIDDLARRMSLAGSHITELISGRLSAGIKKLELLNPSAVIRQHKIKIDDLARQIYIRAIHLFELKRAEFVKAAEKLSGLSPLNILARGYSITFCLPQGEIIKDAKFLRLGGEIKTRLHKGEIISKITEVR